MSDNFLTTIAKVHAARQGISPDAFSAMQATSQLQRANALQDPSLRGLIMQQPQLAGLLGVPSEPRAIDAGADGPGTGPTIQANVPQLPYENPESTAALQRQLLGARTQQFQSFADILHAATGGGGGSVGGTPGGIPGTPGGWTLHGATLSPTGGSLQLGPTKDVTLDSDAIDPTTGHFPTPPPGSRYVTKPSAADAAQAKARNEVGQNIVRVERFITDPQFDKAIASALPSGGGDTSIAGYPIGGALGNLKARANATPLVGQFAAKAGAGDPDVKFLQSATREIIPLVRTDALGTAGLRINIPEITLLGDDLKRLASGNMTAEEAGKTKARLVDFLGQVKAQLAASAAPRALTPSATSPPTGRSLKGPTPGANGLYAPADAARLLMR